MTSLATLIFEDDISVSQGAKKAKEMGLEKKPGIGLYGPPDSDVATHRIKNGQLIPILRKKKKKDTAGGGSDVSGATGGGDGEVKGEKKKKEDDGTVAGLFAQLQQQIIDRLATPIPTTSTEGGEEGMTLMDVVDQLQSDIIERLATPRPGDLVPSPESSEEEPADTNDTDDPNQSTFFNGMVKHYTKLREDYEKRIGISNYRFFTSVWGTLITHLKEVDSDQNLRPEDKTFIIAHSLESFMDSKFKFNPLDLDEMFPNTDIFTTRQKLDELVNQVYPYDIPEPRVFDNIILTGLKYAEHSILRDVQERCYYLSINSLIADPSVRKVASYTLFHAMKKNEEDVSELVFMYPQKWVDSKKILIPKGTEKETEDSYIEEIDKDLEALTSPIDLRIAELPDVIDYLQKVIQFAAKYRINQNMTKLKDPATSGWGALSIGMDDEMSNALAAIQSSEKFKELMASIGNPRLMSITGLIPMDVADRIYDTASFLKFVIHDHLNDVYTERDKERLEKKEIKEAKLFATLVARCFSKRDLPDKASDWVQNISFSGGVRTDTRKILFDYFERMLPDNLRQSMVAYADFIKQRRGGGLRVTSTTSQLRASAWSTTGNISLTDTDSASTVLHEIFHIVEDSNKDLHSRAVGLLSNSINKFPDPSIPTPLTPLANDPNVTVLYGNVLQLKSINRSYEENELYMRSELVHPYTSKLYITYNASAFPNNTASSKVLVYVKDKISRQGLLPLPSVDPTIVGYDEWLVGYIHATEISSSALGDLFKSPLLLYQSDKILFSYATSVLRGE
jgi:hypothetical protein